MAIKEILEDFARGESEHRKQMAEAEKLTQIEIERRLTRLDVCFREMILPSVYEIERDLQHGGFWHKLSIGQSTSLMSGQQNIRDITFYFYPEKTHPPVYTQRALDLAYKALFRASGDYRQITFSIRYPKRLPPGVEKEDTPYALDALEKATVDRFLEKFILGAIDVYRSDRSLR